MKADAAQAQENKQECDRMKKHTMSGERRSVSTVVSWVVLLGEQRMGTF